MVARGRVGRTKGRLTSKGEAPRATPVAALLRAAPGERGQALLDLGGAEPERPGRGDRRQQRRGEIVVVRGQLDAAVGLGQPEGAESASMARLPASRCSPRPGSSGFKEMKEASVSRSIRPTCATSSDVAVMMAELGRLLLASADRLVPRLNDSLYQRAQAEDRPQTRGRRQRLPASE